MPTQYYINRNDKVRGPFSEERIRELYADGKLRDTDFLSTRSDGGWEPVNVVLDRRPSKRATAKGKISSTSSVKSPHRLLWIVLGVAVVAVIGVGIWKLGFSRPDVEEIATNSGVPSEIAPQPSQVNDQRGKDTDRSSYRVLNVGQTLKIAAESPTQIAALRAKLEYDLGHREYVKATRTGHVIIGRIQLEGEDDPETVRAQTVIHPGGFFSDAIANLTDPIGFRRFGYRDIDFVVPAELTVNEAGVIDVGTICMKRQEAPAAYSLCGRVLLEGGEDPGACEVKLWLALGPLNTLSGGFDPATRKDGPALSVEVSKNGELIASGLFAGKYAVTIGKTGFISESRNLIIEVGGPEVTVLPSIELNKSRNVSLEFVVRDSTAAEFVAGSIQQTTLSGGTSWNSMPSKDGLPDIRFIQVGQTIVLEEAWGNSVLCDLGVAEIRDHLDVNEDLAKDRPNGQRMTVGHTYLLIQKTRKHSILFRIIEITLP